MNANVALTRPRLMALAVVGAVALAVLARAGGWWSGAMAPASRHDLVVHVPPAPTATPTPPPWAGSVLAVVVPDGRAKAIALVPVDGDLAPRRLVAGFEDIEAPAWTPDDQTLAFAARRDGSWDIYQVRRDGTGLQRLTDDPAFDGWPAWSPDGKALAFVSHREDDLAVYRLDLPADDETATRVSTGNGPAIEPAWSPDGRWLAYASWHEGAYRIEAVPSDGGEGHMLAETDDGSDLRAPGWSGDGTRLTWLNVRYGAGQLMARAWPTGDTTAGADGAGGSEVLATQVTACAWFPAGESVAVVTAQRSGRSLTIREADPLAPRTTVPLPAGASDIAWSRGPMPAVLEVMAADTSPVAEATGTAQAGLVYLVDVDVPGARILAALAPDYAALRAEVRAATGRDFLGTLADGWRPLGYNGAGSAFFSWHKVGRAFDTQMEFRGPGGRRDMVLVREDVAGRTMWRMFLRAGSQDGTAGRPLVAPGWTFAAGSGDPDLTVDGGRRGTTVPGGYWVDFTALAEVYGWRRIASVARGHLDWRRDWEGIEYWHYERRDGLRWFEAARQAYTEEELIAELAPDRLRVLGVPLNRLAALGFPTMWPEG